jgi:hypothetical protein
VEFLKPSLSGTAAAANRQIAVMRALFEGLRTNNIVVTALMAEQVLSGVETNIQVGEAMRHYRNFTSRTNWEFRSHPLPGRAVKYGARTIFEPDLEECRTLLQ